MGRIRKKLGVGLKECKRCYSERNVEKSTTGGSRETTLQKGESIV